MAEIQQKEKGGSKGKQKKKTILIDFTPMVDMNMLLITFFMMCTSLSKPQTMEISMPSKDQVVEEEKNKVKADRAITLILDGEDKVYYYFGEPNYDDYTSLVETDYSPNGLRAMLLNRNKEVVDKMRELRKDRSELRISEEDFAKRSSEIKSESEKESKDKKSPMVIIKATDEANYKNLVDALDEMHICSIGVYAIVDMTDGDEFLLNNFRAKGEYVKIVNAGS